MQLQVCNDIGQNVDIVVVVVLTVNESDVRDFCCSFKCVAKFLAKR